ncbi:glycosyltransferase family 2 protein [bacterium]
MDRENNVKISVIIPCFNEKNTIQEIVRRVNNVEFSNKEVIIIDDYSDDGSREILKKDIESKVAKVIYHEKNMGKGAAVRTGLNYAAGDIIIIQDADLEYDPSEYPKLVNPIINGKADVVYGSRFVGSSAHRVLYFWHSIGNIFLTFFANMFTNLNLTDMETCYKVFTKEAAKSITIEENRFGFDPEFTIKAAKLKYRIYEVGISYSGRTYSEGKKIGWKDGMLTLWCILKYSLFVK